MESNFTIITGKTINKYLNNIPKVKELIKEAYTLHGEGGNTINPDSYFLRFPKFEKNRIIALPAFIGGNFNVSGIKWIASYPDNINKGIARASAVLILNDSQTGYPLACLEGSIISASRTAASAALAAEELIKDKKVKRLGLIGNGLIARYVYKHLMGNNWQIPEIALFDLNEGTSKKFAKNYLQKKKHKNIYICQNIKELIQSCDLISIATVAAKPYINDLELLSHNPIILHISLRDISPNIILKSNNITDDINHVMKANTSLHLTKKNIDNQDFVNGTLYDLLTKKCSINRDKPTIFSPFGLGILDLALGIYIYNQIENEEKVNIPNFFYKVS